MAGSGLAPEGAWAGVNDSLQSDDHEEVFVVGDAADVPTGIAKQAYHALDMGECVAANVARLLDGRELVPYRPSPKPMLISFGDLTCFMVVGERVVSGAALSAAKEAVFELVMAQLDPAPWWRASGSDRAGRPSRPRAGVADADLTPGPAAPGEPAAALDRPHRGGACQKPCVRAWPSTKQDSTPPRLGDPIRLKLS